MLLLTHRKLVARNDWVLLGGLIVVALVVYAIATPMRWQYAAYKIWHTLWHVLVFAGQAFLCLKMREHPPPS